MAHISSTQTTLTKAGRLAVLLALDSDGLLAGLTLQQVADVIGAGHRSTALRDLRLLPAVRRAYRQAARRAGRVGLRG
jgi:hypothetical protein